MFLQLVNLTCIILIDVLSIRLTDGWIFSFARTGVMIAIHWFMVFVDRFLIEEGEPCSVVPPRKLETCRGVVIGIFLNVRSMAHPLLLLLQKVHSSEFSLG